MSKILAFSGKKQSGKNTLCNFLHGYQLKSYGIIDSFDITQEGELVIETLVVDDTGKTQTGKGLIDVCRVDMEFAVWAMDNVWPFIKHYAFATIIKEIGIGLFDLPKELMYGTDEEKNQLTQYSWENMPTKTKGKTGKMTGREFMQYFGTEICRKIYPDIWTDKAIKDILAEQSNISVISDSRFENEIHAVQKAGGKVIRLTRQVANEDSHESELALDSYTGFDAVLDNQNMTIEESCQGLIKILDEWSWLSKDIVIENQEQKENKRKSVTSIK
jgi:hypothetical protein